MMKGNQVAAGAASSVREGINKPLGQATESRPTWAHLLERTHPDDTETQHSVRQNNGSVSSTTAAYQRAKHADPHGMQAFDALVSGFGLKKAHGTAKLAITPKLSGNTMVYNGLAQNLTSLDIHHDHYEPRRRNKEAAVAPFGHVVAGDFAALKRALPALGHIEMTCAQLTDRFVEAMVAGLAGCPVHTLILHHCSLGSEALLTLLSAWAPTLRTLDFSYNDLGDHDIGGLDFSAARALQHLDLSHCNIDLADINLSACAALQTLNLSSNPGGSSFLMGHDLSGMPNLEVLQLNRTQLVGGSLSHLDVSGNPSLHTLDLGYNALRNDDMHKFCVALPCAIKRLNVSGNAIGAEGFVTLQHKHLNALEELDFADNDLSDYSRYAALSRPSLASWPRLTVLDFAGCDGITQATLRALRLEAAALLQSLDLSSTQLHNDTFAALPWAQMASLRTFRAEFNHITQDGIRQASFDACPALQALDLQNHAMTVNECLQAFASKPNLGITSLWLRNRALDGEDLSLAYTEQLARGVKTRLGPRGYLDV